MTKNMGNADRVVRSIIAVGIAVLYFTGVISGTLAIILGIVAVAFLVTSFIGWFLVATPQIRKSVAGMPSQLPCELMKSVASSGVYALITFQGAEGEGVSERR